ncbi:GNAT family N-acetyltransferase [Atopobacter sp. AH10]|uniref:GNAT family N-acetyltransferase n=1 Tax=Atopobacter sp. AH10 TaxID=2315861 RepID=UPI000EF1836C|nr:GNAT family N-acetyltransferase [Atopobacter sp. AH10]RLK63939.1 GNAT family N-acetyltransferase [Atopobacter sp. AH10]
MNIRKVVHSDIIALAQLMLSVYNAPPWNEEWTEKTARQSLESLLTFPHFYGNVMEKDGKIVAAMLGHIRIYATEKSYYMDEFFVSPTCQGQGFGSHLYQTTLKELKQEGVAGSFFTSLKNSPAYHFYKKQGAKDLADSVCFYHHLY